MNCQEVWDAVVTGGGPAGSAAAIALARAGRKVLLVERRSTVGFKLGESIPPQARPLVDDLLGRTDEPTEQRAGRFRTFGNVSCWGSAEPAVHDFLFSPHGYGLRLDRPRFDRALRRRAEDAGATVLEGTRLQGIHGTGPWELTLSGDAASRHQTGFLIDCSGRRAYVARHCRARRRSSDRLFAFAQRYILAGAAADDDTLTRIEAGPDGWWYTARLPRCRSGDQRLVVFHTDRDLAAARVAACREGFETLLATSTHIAALLRRHGYLASGRPRGAPAGSQRLDRFTGPGWLAAGDAAQAFDPLSSQGIGTALRSGFAAGSTVVQALDGDETSLSRYSRAQEDIHSDYLRQHRYFYACEPRWPSQTFWKRRQAPADRPDGGGPPRKEIPCDPSPRLPS